MTSSSPRGVLLATGAFVFWGLSPLFWRLLAEVPAHVQLAHRVLWSLPSLLLLIAVLRLWPRLRASLTEPRVRWKLFLSGALVSGNWFTFIYAVEHERLLDASLGYYITPLVNVLFGALFLGERLRRAQKLSVGLVLIGVVLRTVDHGSLPWIAVALAGSFGLYGLVKKTVRAGSIDGLTVEILPVFPIALVYALFWSPAEASFAALDWDLRTWLLVTGPVTVLPLLLFGAAATRIPLATIGLLQYIAPTLQFALATLAFGEPFHTAQLLSFALVWTALVIYLYDGQLARRARR